MFQDAEIKDNHMDLLIEKFSSMKVEGNEILSYTSPEDEYNSLTFGVGLRIITEPAVLSISGSDALDFIHRVSTNDVKNLKAFHSAKTLFLNDKGRFIDRTLLLHLDSHFILLGSPRNGNKLFSWINKFIITEDIRVEEAGSKYALFEFNGRQVNSYMTMLAGSQAENISESNLVISECEGIPVIMFRWNSGGLNPLFVLVKRDSAKAFLEYILETKSCFDLNLVGEQAYELFRIENEKPAFPNEINDNINPHENGLIKEVSFTKGCYIGQEVVARLDTYDKVQKKLSGFVPEGEPDLLLPAILYNSEGEEAGEITSYSSGNPAPAALGFIRRKFASPVEKYFVHDRSGNKISLKPKD